MPKILVIDDDPMVRRTIARILRGSGYRIFFAADGGEGVELFEREHPDLVITDLMMPRRDGIATIQAIREKLPAARIIAISGGGRVGNIDFLGQATAVGAGQVIEKPFAPSDLTNSVSRCLAAAA